jgi:hypothetical protein
VLPHADTLCSRHVGAAGGGMKPALRVAFQLNIILIASLLCTAVLKAQTYTPHFADFSFSPTSQFNLLLTSDGTVSMTGGDSPATADLLLYSKRTVVPFAQIQRATQMSMRLANDSQLARLAFPEHSSGPSSLTGFSPGSPAAASSSAGFTRTPHIRSPKKLDAKYVWLNGLQFSLAFADIETTQHCIDEHTCREGNPLMPSSQAGKLAVSLGIASFTAVASFQLKKERSKGWWVAPVMGIAGHAVGLASGLIHW